MHDALFARIHVVKLDAEFSAVCAQRGNLFGRDLIDDVEPPFDRRGHIVINRGNRAVPSSHLASRQPQPFKCLRRSHLMDQMQVDVEHGRLALRLDHHMLLPDLFK